MFLCSALDFYLLSKLSSLARKPCWDRNSNTGVIYTRAVLFLSFPQFVYIMAVVRLSGKHITWCMKLNRFTALLINSGKIERQRERVWEQKYTHWKVSVVDIEWVMAWKKHVKLALVKWSFFSLRCLI